MGSLYLWYMHSIPRTVFYHYVKFQWHSSNRFSRAVIGISQNVPFSSFEFFMIRYDSERFVYIGKNILSRQVKYLLISILHIPSNNLAERNIDKY